MASTTKTIRIIIKIFFKENFFSFWAFGAVMALLCFPGRGTIEENRKGNQSGLFLVRHPLEYQVWQWHVFTINVLFNRPTSQDTLPCSFGFNGLVFSSGTWVCPWEKEKEEEVKTQKWEEREWAVVRKFCCFH